KSDGTVWAWGFNAKGALGDGTTTTRSIPVKVTGLTGVTSIAAGGGGGAGYAVKSDGTAWAWGYNAFGQLGVGGSTDRSAPGRVTGLAGIAGIAGGGGAGYAVTR